MGLACAGAGSWVEKLKRIGCPECGGDRKEQQQRAWEKKQKIALVVRERR